MLGLIFKEFFEPKDTPACPDSITETGLFVPVAVQVEQMLKGGGHLSASQQRLQYDYDSGQEPDLDLPLDPSRDLGYTMAEAAQTMTELADKALTGSVEKSSAGSVEKSSAVSESSASDTSDVISAAQTRAIVKAEQSEPST